MPTALITSLALAVLTGIIIPAIARTRIQLTHPSVSLYTQLAGLIVGTWFVALSLVLGAFTLLPQLGREFPPTLITTLTVVFATLLTAACVGFWVMSTAAVTRNIREVVATLESHLTSTDARPGFTLTVVDHPYPAAVSTPKSGPAPGTIVVTTGLREALTPGQFQAVLAHEYAHVRFRHGKILSIVTNLADAIPLFKPLKRSVSLLVELAADDIAARQAGPADLANALAIMSKATQDPTMHLRAERLTTKRWPREHWRKVPEPIRLDRFTN